MLEVSISVFPRLHLGLLSMHADAPRINGGIGFAVDGPRAIIHATPSSDISVEDVRRFPMAASELEQLREALDAFAKDLSLPQAATVRINGDMQTHVGMGSATAIRLAALEAIALVNRRHVERTALVAASRRGGTSGIGINSYFDGGLLCDLGRPGHADSFRPSSQARGPAPLTLPSLPMPDWPVLLCLPRSIQPKTQEEEIAFFARTTPLPAGTSFETAYVALFELYAATAEENFTGFCQGVNRMQRTAWKRAERAEYGEPLEEISDGLRAAGAACVGMSSLGPMLFCLAEPGRLVDLAAVAKRLGCSTHTVRPANRGRGVSFNDA